MEKIKILKETKEVCTEEYSYFCDKCGVQLIEQFTDVDTSKVVFKTGKDYYNGCYNIEYKEAYFCKECAAEIQRILTDSGVNFITRDFSN